VQVPDVFQQGEAVMVQGVAGGGPSSLPLVRALLLAAAKVRLPSRAGFGGLTSARLAAIARTPPNTFSPRASLTPPPTHLPLPQKRHVELFVTEGTSPDAPADAVAGAAGAGEPPGHALALALSRSSAAAPTAKPISRTVVPDATAWALLSSGRIGKVVLPARAVAVDGSAVVDAGGYGLAVAAHHHGVPVVVVASSLEVLPAHPRDADLRLDTAASGNPTGPGGAPPSLEAALAAAAAAADSVPVRALCGGVGRQLRGIEAAMCC
jgi:hypothetical protein